MIRFLDPSRVLTHPRTRALEPHQRALYMELLQAAEENGRVPAARVLAATARQGARGVKVLAVLVERDLADFMPGDVDPDVWMFLPTTLDVAEMIDEANEVVRARVAMSLGRTGTGAC